MSMGGGGNNDAKNQQKEMDRREDERQKKIRQGKYKIDEAYGQFDDDYYGGYQQAHTDYYFPQLDDQYERAVGQMTSGLAGRGMLDSTVGIDQRAKLLEENNRQRSGIANQAVDSTNKLRTSVENSKSDLYALNQSAADPEAMGALAVGQGTALAAPPTLSPLAQIFTAALSPFLAYSTAQQNKPGAAYQSPAPVNYNPSGYGSGSVVR